MTASLRKGFKGAEVPKGREQKHIDFYTFVGLDSSRYSIREIPRSEKYSFVVGETWRGCHTCSCGSMSGAQNYSLPNLEVTNSLCIHYLAFHRDEISEEQLRRIEVLDDGEVEPTEKELLYPKPKVEERRPMTRKEYLQSIGEL
jgi:hypothetical protein